jgi:integrase
LDEARNLRWQDVSFEHRRITITGGQQGTKNHEFRTVPMTDALAQLLERIHGESHGQPSDLVIPIRSARKCLETACRRLELPAFSHHDFRHFFATTCIEAGVDIPTVSRWLGHKDGGALAMRVYGHLRQEHSFSQIKRVSLGGAPQPPKSESPESTGG